MGRFARLAAAALALGVPGCQLQPSAQPALPTLLVCHGDFGQFSNGYMVSRPMELRFLVDWLAPWVVPIDGGSPARIISLTSLELSFEVQYEGYRAAYHVTRVDGTFSQRPSVGGVFFGRCDTKPLETKF